MIESILTFIAVAWFCILFTTFTPIQYFLDNIYAKYNTPFWFDYLITPLTCPKCLAFYVFCIIYQDLTLALIGSLLTFIIKKLTENNE